MEQIETKIAEISCKAENNERIVCTVKDKNTGEVKAEIEMDEMGANVKIFSREGEIVVYNIPGLKARVGQVGPLDIGLEW